MRRFFQSLQSLASLVEGKDLIDHGLRTIGRKGPIHSFKVGPGAHINAVNPNLAMENQVDR